MKSDIQFHKIDVRTSSDTRSHRWHLSSTGRRIPASYLFDWQQAQEWISQANRILSLASKEAEKIKHQAHEAGLREGREKALSQAAESIISAQVKSRQFMEEQQASVVDLAFHIVKKILPALPADLVKKALVESALSELSGEKFIRVYIAPGHAGLPDQSRQPAVEIITDPELDAFSCTVESELGAIHCNIDSQLTMLRQQLDDTAVNQREPSVPVAPGGQGSGEQESGKQESGEQEPGDQEPGEQEK
ncbi:MAG: hypothetical protein CSA52_00945 [Gammaproteobacteria bacterium]|nr:MAG: hypothetical protein CSB48_08110 [Pseudomonadota bacterium]PIE38865.1 MAG: hypothetical protein CSA52_00945 [Gammaproteobacteria bacterium]